MDIATISSMLSSSSKDMFGCPSSPQRTQIDVAPPSTTPPDRDSSSSPVPQPSPSSPSQLSPGLFVSPLSSSPFSSSSPVPFSSSSTSSAANGPAVANQAYVSATNSLMELSDIISQHAHAPKLPVPRAGAAAEESWNPPTAATASRRQSTTPPVVSTLTTVSTGTTTKKRKGRAHLR